MYTLNYYDSFNDQILLLDLLVEVVASSLFNCSALRASWSNFGNRKSQNSRVRCFSNIAEVELAYVIGLFTMDRCIMIILSQVSLNFGF